jgi:hypothetical protein
VGRGVVDVLGSLSRVVLANLSAAPVLVRAGQVVGYGYEIDMEQYELREVGTEETEPPRRTKQGSTDRSQQPDGATVRNLAADSPASDAAPCPELTDIWPRLSETVRSTSGAVDYLSIRRSCLRTCTP